MSHLTSEQVRNLDQQLRTLIARLRGEIAGALRANGSTEAIGLANHLEEIDDDAVADLESALEIASIERDMTELRAAEKALARLSLPSPGLCDDCNAPIPFARLNASPIASRCLDCQTRAERAQGRPSL